MSTNKPELQPMLLRQRAGLTQFEVAVRIGRSLSTIAKWEAGSTVLRGKPSEIKRACEVYQCTIEELIAAFEPELAADQN